MKSKLISSSWIVLQKLRFHFLILLIIIASVGFFGCAPSQYHDSDFSDAAPVQEDQRTQQIEAMLSALSASTTQDANYSCGPLHIPNYLWPQFPNQFELKSLLLALNISGSFEGSEGWGNITDNFDGEGFGLGLLSQNLGMGTLQPELIWVRDHQGRLLDRYFSPEEKASLLNMLAQWEGSRGLVGSDDADALSVRWAVRTLYQNGHFKKKWYDHLRQFASNRVYVTKQLTDALSFHENAKEDMRRGGFQTLTAYLFMFDIEVQNGGFTESDWTAYVQTVNAHGPLTEIEKLTLLLQIRLKHVRLLFKYDVISRKRAIIQGYGIVHGTRRSLEKEFCYTGSRRVL